MFNNDFDLGYAAFYAGERIDYAKSKSWRDGWQYGFTCAMRQYEREKEAALLEDKNRGE